MTSEGPGARAHRNKTLEDQRQLMIRGEPGDLQTESILNSGSQLSFPPFSFFFRFQWQVSCEFSEAVKLLIGILFYRKPSISSVTGR